MKLSAVEEKFILHWGEMGTRWGINRTVAQIHALLYLSAKALNAEEITGTLSVARSNVSNSLRELQGWGIVRVVHVLGDRRDHFETFGHTEDQRSPDCYLNFAFIFLAPTPRPVSRLCFCPRRCGTADHEETRHKTLRDYEQ